LYMVSCRIDSFQQASDWHGVSAGHAYSSFLTKKLCWERKIREANGLN
jgi:hypothetical protein